MRAALLLVTLIGVAGCDRTHLWGTYGQRVRKAFATQTINPNAGEKAKPESGLDPEEAAQVHSNYRRSLSPTKNPGDAPPVLILQPPKEQR